MARIRALAVVFSLLLTAVACAGDDDSPATSAAPSGVELPDSPVGNQVAWFVEASASGTIAPADYEAHFAADFRAAVPVDQLVASLAGGRYEVIDVRPGLTPHYLTATVTQGGVEYVLTANVDAAAAATPITGLTLRSNAATPDSPAGRPTSWEELDARAAALAPRVGLVVSAVDSAGGCASLHRLAPDEPQPLASVMKLYVLGALAEAVRGQRAAWGQQVPVEPALATLPSGVLQLEPAGTAVAVRDLAALMISISDNTATDHLIQLVGRSAVEDQLARFSIADPFTNLPFITINESFVLQLTDYPNLADQWRAADTAVRRALLGSPAIAGAEVTIENAAGWTDPRWEGIGWFGSPADVCLALGGLHAQAADPAMGELGDAMSISDGGLGLDKATWPTTWFKGGSEPGVFTLAYLAEHTDGRVIAVALLLADPAAALDEATVAPEALTLVRAAFDLAG